MNRSQPERLHHPQGFLSLAKNVGIKDATLDLTVIYSTVRARAAALFTRNRFPGAPVIVGRKHIANGYAQALVINSKNANVAMGKQGIDNVIETCRIVGRELGISRSRLAGSSGGSWASVIVTYCHSPPALSAGRCRWIRCAPACAASAAN